MGIIHKSRKIITFSRLTVGDAVARPISTLQNMFRNDVPGISPIRGENTLESEDHPAAIVGDTHTASTDNLITQVTITLVQPCDCITSMQLGLKNNTRILEINLKKSFPVTAFSRHCSVSFWWTRFC